jgi:hypothetical protein
MDLKAFENLELIPNLLDEILSLQKRLELFAPTIETKVDVARYLGCSTSTVNNYMRNGLLVEGKHFYRKNAKMLVFIESAIVKFKKELKRGIVNEEVKV